MLCSGTLLPASFREKVEAAAAAGFSGLSLWPRYYRGARAEGFSDADLRSLLADHGLEISELDPLLSWLPGSDPGPAADAAQRAFFSVTEGEFYAMADALGGRCLNAAQGLGTRLDLDAAVEAFAGLCDRAAGHGLRVGLEFLPWSGIPDAATAGRIVELAGRDNAGVTVDSWHHFRGARDADQLRALPGARIAAVQLNDASPEPWPDLPSESMRARRLPGEGAIDLVELVRALDGIGSEAPIGVEVFSEALMREPPGQVARRAAEATRAVLARARGSG